MPVCPGAPISTRRMLTVTISAPLAAIASRIVAKSLYFPVPTMRRDVNVFPPMTSWSVITSLPTLRHRHDFDDVVGPKARIGNLPGTVDFVAVHHDHQPRV